MTTTSQGHSARASRLPAGSLRERAESTGRHVVLLHIGEPKTGTTFLQDAMWANRAALHAQGVHLPGRRLYDQFRATRDLRNVRYDGAHPRGSWVGEWDIMAAQARQGKGVSVISHELLMAAEPAHVTRAAESLAPAELHIAITVRDLASLLPAAWQEAVKNGETLGWDDWARIVVDRTARRRARQRHWFWRLHDTVPVVRRWAAVVPPEHIHVVTIAPPGSPRGLLWQRWADLVGFDAAGTEVDTARANSSLGWAEVDFLRAVNARLHDTVPRWAYETYIKPTFAGSMLAGRPRAASPALTAETAAWVDGYTERRARLLRELGVDVRGDLADLRRRPDDESAAAAQPGAADLAAVGVDAVAQLLTERVLVEAAAPNKLKRAARELTARYRWLGRLRVTAWRLANRG